jgi:deoxyribonuclease V
MRTTLPPDWPTDIKGARALQERQRGRVVAEGGPEAPGLIAGVDVHVSERTGLTWAAVVLLNGRSLELEASVLAAVPTGFPYVPGYLSFREIPAVLEALAMLERAPDLVMVDGQGIAHPRRFGIAAHLGVMLDVPTIGVAKSRLTGRHDEPGEAKGSRVPLTDRGEVIGAVVRTRDRVSPLYVSVGHRIGLERAIQLVLRTTTRWRLPEPTRLADKVSRMHPA